MADEKTPLKNLSGEDAAKFAAEVVTNMKASFPQLDDRMKCTVLRKASTVFRKSYLENKKKNKK